MGYDRAAAVRYAHEWAFRRNLHYYNFDAVGGDCTNFASQCLYAGGCQMQYSSPMGWYYRSADDRAPAWSSAAFLHQFLTHNEKSGPRASEILLSQLLPGDLVQFAFEPETFTHTAVVVSTGVVTTAENILLAAHTQDCDLRPLLTYDRPVQQRYLHIGLEN